MSPDPAGNRPRFLALGDSYTIGEGVSPEQRWPDQLAARLRGDSIDIADPTIIATTGWTTDELASAIAATTLTPPYALVTVLIGVNNQYRGRALDNYRTEFDALLRQAIGFAGNDARRVIVVSIPDWGVTGFARANHRDATLIATDIDGYNAAARDIALAHAVTFVDITDLTRLHPDEVVDDALHPSAEQYRRWVKRIVMPASDAIARS